MAVLASKLAAKREEVRAGGGQVDTSIVPLLLNGRA